MTRWLARALGRLTGRIGSADAAAYEKAARDAFRSATPSDAVPSLTASPASIAAGLRPLDSTTTLTTRSDALPEDVSSPIPAEVSRTATDVASVGVAQTAATLEGAIRPWGPKAPTAAPRTFTLDPVKAEAAAVVTLGAADAVRAEPREAVTAGAPEPVIAGSAEAVTAGAREWVAVASTVADQETAADWEVGNVDAASRLSNRQAGDTAPEFLMRAPPSVGMTADAFFDGLVRRVESDR